MAHLRLQMRGTVVIRSLQVSRLWFRNHTSDRPPPDGVQDQTVLHAVTRPPDQGTTWVDL